MDRPINIHYDIFYAVFHNLYVHELYAMKLVCKVFNQHSSRLIKYKLKLLEINQKEYIDRIICNKSNIIPNSIALVFAFIHSFTVLFYSLMILLM